MGAAASLYSASKNDTHTGQHWVATPHQTNNGERKQQKKTYTIRTVELDDAMLVGPGLERGPVCIEDFHDSLVVLVEKLSPTDLWHKDGVGQEDVYASGDDQQHGDNAPRRLLRPTQTKASPHGVLYTYIWEGVFCRYRSVARPQQTGMSRAK
jgi:hypothetical protein